MNSSLKRYLICTAVGLAVALAAAAGGGIFKCADKADILRILSDGAFVAGAVLLAVGGLIWTGNKGAGDGFGFAARTILTTKFTRKEKQESFSDYRERKHSKDRSPRALLICGAAFFLIALCFLGIYDAVI